MYDNTPLRAVPYLIGMALGYILANKVKIKLNIWGILGGWIMSAGLCLSVIYTILIPYSPTYVENRLDAAFYAAFHKLGWSLGVAWVIWACVNGYGGTK
jgi:CDP-diglyceride synthetase